MELGLKIKRIHDMMEKRANREAARLGVTFSQHHVLKCLQKNGGECDLKELERHFGTAQSTMAGIISRLEEKNLVSSSRDPADRRIKKVSLTDTGIEVCEKSYKSIRQAERQLVSRMSAGEEKELNRLLDLLYETVAEIEEKEAIS